MARRGKVGEEVITYTDGGLVEKVDKIGIDLDTGNPEWVLMKCMMNKYMNLEELLENREEILYFFVYNNN